MDARYYEEQRRRHQAEVLLRKEETDRLLLRNLRAVDRCQQALARHSSARETRRLTPWEMSQLSQEQQRQQTQPRQQTPLTDTADGHRMLATAYNDLELSKEQLQQLLEARCSQAATTPGVAAGAWTSTSAAATFADDATAANEALDAEAVAGVAVQQQRADTRDELASVVETLERFEIADDEKVAREVEKVKAHRKKKQEDARRLSDLPAATLAKFQALLRAPGGQADMVEVAHFYKYRLRQKDLKTLRHRTWINDEIVNAFLWLLDNEQPEMFAHTTFFITTLMGPRGYDGVRRWTSRRKVDLFSMEQLLVPINIHNTHWTMIGCDLKAKTITYYDSMSGNGRAYLEAVMDYLVAEYADKKDGAVLDRSKWKLFNRPPDQQVPQQENGVDCGVFTCVCAMHLARKLPLTYSQQQIARHWRPYVACSILDATPLPR